MNNHQGRVWELFLILTLTAFIFLPALSQSFVSWDDEGHLSENLQVRSLSLPNIISIFRSEVNRTYIPLTTLSFALEHAFFGYHPFVYHLDNLLLHLAVVVIVYVLALHLGFGSAAASLAALLFAIHPMHVESVVWVTQRKDVLYSFFYLLSIWQYLVYLRKGKASALVCSLTFGFLSVLAKPMALSLPLVLSLLDWFVKRPLCRRLVTEKLAFALLIWPVAWQTYAMNMRVIDFQWPQSLLIWIWCLVFYVSRFFLPYELLVLYELPRPVSLGNPEYAWSAAFFVMLIIFLLRKLKNRALVFAFGYFFLSVFFLLRFDNRQDLTVVADRFMYLPSLGACLLLGLTVARMIAWSREQKRGISRCVLGGVVLVIFTLGALTSIRVRDWANEEVLWGQVVRRYDSGLAHAQLGNYFLKNGDLGSALARYQSAIERLPAYSKPYSNRGMVMLKLGRMREAELDFTRAIELDEIPSAVTFNNRGYLRMLMREDRKALEDYNRAIAIDPKYVPVLLNRATLYKNRGDLSEARKDLERVLMIDPGNAIAKNNIRILEG